MKAGWYTKVLKYICIIIINMKEEEVSEETFIQFIQSIKKGSVEEVEKFLRASPASIVNKLDQQTKQPALYFAAVVEGDQISAELFKLLIRHGANIRFKDHNEQTVLFYVCREGKQRCAQILLSQGLSLDDVDCYGQTPMFYAANDNRIEIVRKYATKERVNHQDNLAQQTPLYYAARRGHMELCRILIEKGADIGHIDSTGKSAIEFAKKAKFNEVADLLTSELKRLKEVGKFSQPSQSFEESNVQKRKKKGEAQKPLRQTYKIVFLSDKGEPHDLTEEEARSLIKQRPELQQYLANPQAIPQQLLQRTSQQSWQKSALKILTQCCKLRGSFWFAQPVDAAKYNILDYYQVIIQPMDLSSIRKKLNHNCYPTAQSFVADMTLIWQNCYRYNGVEHDISKCAKELQTSFNEYVSSYGLDRFLQQK